MKLYRFTGRKEHFRDCGMLDIEPLIGSNVQHLEQRVNSRLREWDRLDLLYRVRIECLVFKPIKRELLADMYQEQDMEILLESCSTIKEWRREDRNPTEE